MKLYPYSARTRELLDNPPKPGENRHHWLFKVQASLINQGFDPAEVEKRTVNLCRDFGWVDRLSEIPRNTAAILNQQYQEVEADKGPPMEWPEINPAARRERFAHPRMFAFQDTGLRSADVLPVLYAESEWICAATDRFNANTYRLAELVPVASDFEFIVANPMQAQFGKTNAGKRSPRTKQNACTEAMRKYAVIEFDTNDEPYDQIAALSSLHTANTPLFMAVWSGNKSIHGWYDLGGISRNQKRTFYRFARYLGADNALWGTSWLVRMPGGKRASGDRQTILYFEPEHVHTR